jgi:hypothetical protein
MRRGLVTTGMVALCMVVALGVAGCTPGVSMNTAPVDGGPATPANAAQPIAPPPTAASESVTVPDVLGKYYDEAAKTITAAGLEPVDISIHGPIDEDAGEIGTIYRQTPKAGEAVAPGTKVELRSWWESQ